MNPLTHETSSSNDGTMFWSKVELWIGAALAGLGTLLLLMWWTGRAADRHGMIFVFLGGAFVLPFGVAFILAGVGLRLRARSLVWAVAPSPMALRVLRLLQMAFAPITERDGPPRRSLTS